MGVRPAARRASSRGCARSAPSTARCSIFDEVMTGFRVALRRRAGALRHRRRTSPTFGKVIGGGLPRRRLRRPARRSWSCSRRSARSTRPARCRATRWRWPPASPRSTRSGRAGRLRPAGAHAAPRSSAASRGAGEAHDGHRQPRRLDADGCSSRPARCARLRRRRAGRHRALRPRSSAHCSTAGVYLPPSPVRGGVRLARRTARPRSRAPPRPSAPSPPRSTRPRPRDRPAGRPRGGGERGLGPGGAAARGPRRAAAVRARSPAPRFADGVEAIYEGFLVHHARGRVFAAAGPPARPAARRLPLRHAAWSASAARATSRRSRRSPTSSRWPPTCGRRATSTATTAGSGSRPRGTWPGPATAPSTGQGRAAGRRPRAAARARGSRRAGPPPARPARAADGAGGARRVSYRDLREWIDLLRRAGELVEIDARGRPAPRDHRDRRPRHEGAAAPRCCSATCAARSMPLLINQFGTERRMCLALGVERLDDVAAADRRRARADARRRAWWTRCARSASSSRSPTRCRRRCAARRARRSCSTRPTSTGCRS